MGICGTNSVIKVNPEKGKSSSSRASKLTSIQDIIDKQQKKPKKGNKTNKPSVLAKRQFLAPYNNNKPDQGLYYRKTYT